jgi:hypothetical protein
MRFMLWTKHDPQVAMPLSDLDRAGKILALEKCFCPICGASFVLWPPETLEAHMHEKHESTFWPEVTQKWTAFQTSPDPDYRFRTILAYRTVFLLGILSSRADLYEKLVIAGVIEKRKNP